MKKGVFTSNWCTGQSRKHARVRTVRIVAGLTTGENFAEVDAGALRESADNPSCLVALQGPIRLHFMLEHPFAVDHRGVGRARNKSPGVVGDEGVELGLHGGTPVGIAESFTDRGGKRGDRCGSEKRVGVARIRLEDVVPCARDHRMARRSGMR